MLDTSKRDWLISGSKIHFGIIEKDRITTMNYDGSYDITDTKLDELPKAKIRAIKIKKILEQVNRFYKK